MHSVFCLRTRLVRISAASPIHSSNQLLEQHAKNQRECPLDSIPTRTLGFLFEFAVKLLRFFAMSSDDVRRPRRFRCLRMDDLLAARMIVTPYNQHVRLLSSEPFGWFAPPKFTRAGEPTLLWNHFTDCIPFWAKRQ